MTQLIFKMFYSIIYAVLGTWRSIAAAVATRPRADCSSMEGHTSLSTTLVITVYDSATPSARLFLSIRRPVSTSIKKNSSVSPSPSRAKVSLSYKDIFH